MRVDDDGDNDDQNHHPDNGQPEHRQTPACSPGHHSGSQHHLQQCQCHISGGLY